MRKRAHGEAVPPILTYFRAQVRGGTKGARKRGIRQNGVPQPPTCVHGRHSNGRDVPPWWLREPLGGAPPLPACVQGQHANRQRGHGSSTLTPGLFARKEKGMEAGGMHLFFCTICGQERKGGHVMEATWNTPPPVLHLSPVFPL